MLLTLKSRQTAMNQNTNNLHNNHNVYILGAGFSRRRGLPLIYDFMVVMRDALQYHASKNHKRQCKAIEQVLQFRLKASAAAYRVQIDLENIEELFSLASASKGHMEESIKLAIAATLEYSMKNLTPPNAKFTAHPNPFTIPNDNWKLDSSHLTAPPWHSVPGYEFILRALLGNWGSDRNSLENTFITFNYDTLVEEAITHLGLKFSLGLNPTTDDHHQHTKILKLHGSVNWTIPKGSRSNIEVMQDYQSVVNAGLTPQIIPPTWKKDSRGKFDEIWSQSLDALMTATRVVVIGFSIPPTDLHFKYLLAAGLRENYSLREIVFINPSPGIEIVKKRCDEFFANQSHNAAKVRFVSQTIESFVGQGTDLSHVGSIGRPIPESIQGLNF
jgi:SIR2-like domain